MKFVLATIFVIGLLITMTACNTATYTCAFCGRESTTNTHTSNVGGSEITICDECYNGISELIGK